MNIKNLFYVLLANVMLVISCNGQEKQNTNQEYMTTTTGLKYKITQAGTGVKPKQGDMVSVHYTGKLTDGKVFDSSIERGQPFTFELGAGRVIKGWDEGIALLNEGSKAILEIPPQLGYGNTAIGPIPANSTLIFEVELVKVAPAPVIEPFNVAGKDTLKTNSGLKYIVVSKGTGTKATAGKTVHVHYTGYFTDGKIFDSSVKRGEPLPFVLGAGQVIKGWDEGVALMQIGDKLRLIIPPDLGYGVNGYPGAIPPNATLIFDVELMDVK